MATERRSRKRRKVESAETSSQVDIFTSSSQLEQRLDLTGRSSLQIKQCKDVCRSWTSPLVESSAALDNFASFLARISSSPDSDRQGQLLQVLKGYCDGQASVTHEQVDFPVLLSAWSAAADSKDEIVLAAILSALTQFFRTISGRLDFREFGLSLSHSLLKRDQVRAFDKCLSSPRSHDHLVASSFELLSEIISFDGGTLSGKVFSRRDHLYKRLDELLGLQSSRQSSSEGVSGHAAAVNFLLANLRYLDSPSKTELITHGKTLSSMVWALHKQSAGVIIAACQTLERSVLADEGLSAQTKRRCFNAALLSALGKLFDFGADSDLSGEGVDAQKGVRQALQRLLVQACASPNGVLLPQTGWYPIGFNPDIVDHDDATVELGLDSPYYSEEHTDKFLVKNKIIASFLQSLHPEKDILQAELITTVFSAAPELVADYFAKKPKLLASPGGDGLWRGQFAFLFSITQLPAPANCGWPGTLPPKPPPLSVVIESILPRPFDLGTITKCLREKNDVLAISAARLVTVTLEKLSHVLDLFKRAESQASSWHQASRKLISLVSNRIPPLQDIVTVLQSLDKDKDLIRMAALECMATSLRVLPAVNAGFKFDIGPTLTATLERLESDDGDEQTRSSLSDQIPWLVEIASSSAATKWLQGPTSATTSLATQILKHCVLSMHKTATSRCLPILESVLHSTGVLDPQSRSFEALVASLTPTKKWFPDLVTFQFLDGCMARTMQRPVRYLDQLEQAQQLLSDSKPLSLLACCIAEQWPFATKKQADEKPSLQNVADWIARFFSSLESAGENFRVMTDLKTAMTAANDEQARGTAILLKAFEKCRNKPVTLSEPQPRSEVSETTNERHHEAVSSHARGLETVQINNVKEFPPLAPLPQSLKGLERWAKPDFEIELSSSRLERLFRCLISPADEVRRQAFTTLQTVIHEVEQSSYSGKTQLYLLIGEVLETIRFHESSQAEQQPEPPPSIVAELAIQMLPVLADPSGPFYRKTNKFLLRAPHWTPSSIIKHWLTESLLSEPECDDVDLASLSLGGRASGNAHALEVDHFLDLLSASLRTAQDLDLFRSTHVFTRVFSYYLSPACPKSARNKILLLVYRAALVPGGSYTLITRTGVREWLVIISELRGHSGHGATMFGKVDADLKATVAAVSREVSVTCDQSAVSQWEKDRRVFRTSSSGAAMPAGAAQKE